MVLSLKTINLKTVKKIKILLTNRRKKKSHSTEKDFTQAVHSHDPVPDTSKKSEPSVNTGWTTG